jgi:hypothetical protein
VSSPTLSLSQLWSTAHRMTAAVLPTTASNHWLYVCAPERPIAKQRQDSIAGEGTYCLWRHRWVCRRIGTTRGRRPPLVSPREQSAWDTHRDPRRLDPGGTTMSQEQRAQHRSMAAADLLLRRAMPMLQAPNTTIQGRECAQCALETLLDRQPSPE